MRFNDLLSNVGIDPREVAVMSHAPSASLQRRTRMALAEDDRRSFELYQDNHPRTAEATWKARLKQWRGIYLITDQANGERYAGAAYGETNLLGRWQAHPASRSGITVELAQRSPKTCRFSIRELVSPTATTDPVPKLETSWKHRLHRRVWGLNRN